VVEALLKGRLYSSADETAVGRRDATPTIEAQLMDSLMRLLQHSAQADPKLASLTECLTYFEGRMIKSIQMRKAHSSV
jgi:hypothetical protein